jgi:peptide/nickel transport system substrate-binding protein
MAAFANDRRTFLKGLGASAAIAAFGGSFLAACGNPTTAAGGPGAMTPVRGGRAVLATQGPPVNLDPADGQLYASMQVYQNIFSELLEVGPDFTFRPNLAASWSQEDASTWTFDLVDNAVFQNGEPVTAADVAYTVARMKSHSLGAYLQFFDKVDVLGPHRCRIHLSKPYGPMEATMASLVDITNEKAIDAADPKSNPVGCGPYKLDQWAKGSSVTLSRWEKYFKPTEPYLDQLTFRAVADNTVRLTGLQTGQFDWIQTVPPQQVESLARNSSISHTEAGPFLPYLVLLNSTAPPFDDVRVRQAVAWAVDRSEIVKLAFFGSAVEATEAVSPPNPFYSGANPYAGGPDLDKAKALLSQAGVSTLDVSFIVEQEVPEYTSVAQILQSQLAKIGINLHIQTVSSAEYFGILVGKKYGMATTYFSASLDPAMAYYLLGHSTSGFNLSGLRSSQLDSLLDKFTFEADQKVRKLIYPDVVNAFAEQAPFVFLANQQQQYWTKPTLRGAQPLPSLEIRAEDLWLSS